MLTDLCYVIAPRCDPYENIAVEEALLHRVEPGQCILYLWQNERTVVLGRNQNAFAECRVETLRADGGRLARRLSGGGAVYHDLGNLNFTFLVRREDYDVPRQLTVIERALRRFGLPAERSGRNDVTVAGRKCSGNAFYRSGERCYHHGTLLVCADTAQMSRYLHVSREKLRANGVASVRARVGNLAELNPAVTVPALRAALLDAFAEVCGGAVRSLPLPADVAERAAFFGSEEWLLGKKTAFCDEAAARFPWGGVQLCYTVRGGVVEALRLFSDGMEAGFLAGLPRRLEGRAYSRAGLDAAESEIWTEHAQQAEMLHDCISLLKAQIE